MPLGRSPMKKLEFRSIATRRLLLGWWLGSYPRSREEALCYVCGLNLPSEGKRALVAKCLEDIPKT
jgi:hypothetical protein